MTSDQFDHGAPRSAATVCVLAVGWLVLLVPGCGGPPGGSEAESALYDAGILASRLFAGPDQYPPERFAAYGILAFQAEATSASRNRYLAICEGFVASLPNADTLGDRGIPLNLQMATVWPLKYSMFADELNAVAAQDPLVDRCGEIVDNIDIITSGMAIYHANNASETATLDGDGPYLLAWSPSTAFGQAEVPVLKSDLSNVTTAEQATRRFVAWRMEIQQDPTLWNDGWNLERVRELIGLWADRYGRDVLQLLGWEGT